MERRRLRYKGVSVNMFGLPNWTGDKKRVIVSKSKRSYLKSFNFSFQKNAPKNLMLIYDIPHEKKKERDWFRRQLRRMDFVMIQKSVWVGPSPLPLSFINYLKSINLRKDFKIFKIIKPYK